MKQEKSTCGKVSEQRGVAMRCFFASFSLLVTASCKPPGVEADSKGSLAPVVVPTQGNAQEAQSSDQAEDEMPSAALTMKGADSCADEMSSSQLGTMILAMLNANYFSQFVIRENPDAVPVRFSISELEKQLRSAMLQVQVEYFGERVEITEGEMHRAAIVFRSWLRKGNLISIEIRFPARSVAGQFEFLCKQGEWVLDQESGFEYKPRIKRSSDTIR